MASDFAKTGVIARFAWRTSVSRIRHKAAHPGNSEVQGMSFETSATRSSAPETRPVTFLTSRDIADRLG